MEKVCAFAPATVANLSVGFDVLGLAMSKIGDKVEVCFNDKGENEIIEIINGDGLPRSFSKNCCGVVIEAMQQALDEKRGVNVRIKKGLESSSGLGSSSASGAAAAVAFNGLLGDPFTREELIVFAVEGEKAACGTAHADNVAPALLGGIVLVRAHDPVDVLQLPVPDELCVVSLFPKVKVDTSDARSILGEQLPLKTASAQWANMGAFVTSLFRSDYDLMKRSLQDAVAEPVRKILIPKFEEIGKATMEEGAVGFGIAGSGPSVFALTKGLDAAEKVGGKMKAVFDGTGIFVEHFVESPGNNKGAVLCASW